MQEELEFKLKSQIDPNLSSSFSFFVFVLFLFCFFVLVNVIKLFLVLKVM